MKKKFQARMESLENIDKFITAAALAAGLTAKAAYAVRLAVDEACANIIEHAYQNEGGEIECIVQDTMDQLIVTLRDWGKPFDPDLVPEPDIAAPLEKRTKGGLGLYFMLKMMDEVKFDFPTDGPNKLTMVKKKVG